MSEIRIFRQIFHHEIADRIIFVARQNRTHVDCMVENIPRHIPQICVFDVQADFHLLRKGNRE